jgi:WS/DGAT/MGAT family acyltransferase
MTAFMSSSDAFTWAMESDPRLRSTVVTVLLLDRIPDWREVRGRIHRLSQQLPMLRQRVVPTALGAPPRWQDCADFDLDFHMRRAAVPAGGSFDNVLELARLAEMEDFDRARPLWKITLVEGLPEGQAAVVCVFHHALSDGVGGIEIAMALFGLSDLPNDGRPTPQVSDEPLLGSYRDAVSHDISVARHTVSSVESAVAKLASDALRSPIDTLRAGARLAASVYRTVRPINSTGSSLITTRSLRRQLGTLDVPMPALREAAHRSGGALNDAFIAGVAGGLRLYHEQHGAEVDALHLTMPISLRAKGDAPGGNRITLMRFDVPVGLADPRSRIELIHERTNRLRHEESLPHTQLIAGFLNKMPRWYIGSILRHVDFLASDVPGIPIPVSLGGAKVLKQYAFGPTIGAAVNVTLLTYVDTCSMGINVDTGAIPDFASFVACLRAGFAEVMLKRVRHQVAGAR